MEFYFGSQVVFDGYQITIKFFFFHHLLYFVFIKTQKCKIQNTFINTILHKKIIKEKEKNYIELHIL